MKTEESAGQRADERVVPITYRAEIYARSDGEEVRLDRGGKGSSIAELADDLIAQASDLAAEAQEKVGQAVLDKRQEEQTVSQKELSGRHRRSWE